MECAEDQLSLLEVLRLVEQDDRVAPDDRLKDAGSPPGCRTSGGAMKTCLISSGSEIITNGGVASSLIVKRLP